MSRSKSELSITKRLLLDYVKFKTNNNHQFFGSNEYIGSALDLTTATAKVMVNELIRQGYLYKETDRNNRRILSLTGKEYKPLFENMTNVDKALLKSQLKEEEYQLKDAQKELALKEIRIETLEKELAQTKTLLSNFRKDILTVMQYKNISAEQLQQWLNEATHQSVQK